MTRIILVRHGRTEWNKEEIFRGTIDVPLDDHGRKEAALARDWLREESFHAAYTSPLCRAVETAEIILSPHGTTLSHHQGLSDLCYGDWQGKSLTDVKTLYPELFRQWQETPHKVVFPKGEDLSSARHRALKAMQDIVDKHEGKTVLVAAHRVINKVLIAALLGLDNSHFWQIGQDTAALNEFSFQNDKWLCRGLNDTCHLRDLEGRVTTDF